MKTKKKKKSGKMKKNCISPPLSMFRLGRFLQLQHLREVDLLDFQVFVGGLITILGSDIILKSSYKGNRSLCLFIEL